MPCCCVLVRFTVDSCSTTNSCFSLWEKWSHYTVSCQISWNNMKNNMEWLLASWSSWWWFCNSPWTFRSRSESLNDFYLYVLKYKLFSCFKFIAFAYIWKITDIFSLYMLYSMLLLSKKGTVTSFPSIHTCSHFTTHFTVFHVFWSMCYKATSFRMR